MKSCLSCGTPLRELRHQTRAADEAATVVTTCPKCPLRSDKMYASKVTGVPFQRFSRPVRRRHRPSEPRILPLSHILTELHLCIFNPSVISALGEPSRQIYKRISLMPSRSSSSPSMKLPVVASKTIEGVGPKEVYVYERSRIEVGKGAFVVTYEAYRCPDTTDSTEMSTGEYWYTDNGGIEHYVYKATGESRVYAIVNLGKTYEEIGMLQKLEAMYVGGYAPCSLYDLLHKDFIAKAKNLSPRAWDAPVAPARGYTSTSKPDGERMTAVMINGVAYFCETTGDCKVRHWWIDMRKNGVATSPGPTVVEVERVYPSSSIVIDVLSDSSGTHAPAAACFT